MQDFLSTTCIEGGLSNGFQAKFGRYLSFTVIGGKLVTVYDLKGTQCFVHLNRQQQFQTNKCSMLVYKKLYCINTRPWGSWRPSRELYRRAASLLGWKSSLSLLFFGRNFTNLFGNIYRNKKHVDC